MYVILWCRNKKVLSLDYKSWMRSLRFETSQTPSIYMYTECDKSFSDAIHGNRPHLTEWWLCVTMTICLCCSSYHFEGKGYFDPAIYIYPTSDNVPRSYLEEKEMECMAKDETIRMLNSKIRRLEHLLQLKDTRMLDLQGQIAREQGLYYVTSRKHVVK